MMSCNIKANEQKAATYLWTVGKDRGVQEKDRRKRQG